MKLFERAIDGIAGELVLLAPQLGAVPGRFMRTYTDRHGHARLLREAQRLRGKVYLEDGAIEETQLTPDGRHEQAVDPVSWHLLAINGRGEVRGCARYRHHWGDASFQQLGIRHAAIAKCPRLGPYLQVSVETEITEARRRGIGFAEVGGWAIAAEKRLTIEALRIALATYGLAQTLGGCLGLTTATVRHHSSTILRRIGGRSLGYSGVTIPPYYDPQYRCQMEVLRFDSSAPDAAYRQSVELLRKALLSVAVVTCPLPLGPQPATILPQVPSVEALPWPAAHQFS